MSDIVDRYNRIKNLLDESRTAQNEAAGAFKELLAQATKKYKCKSLKELQTLLAEAVTATEEKEKVGHKALEKLERKWANELG